VTNRGLLAVSAVFVTSLVLAAMAYPGVDASELPGDDALALDVPIVLVPGWLDTGRDLADLRIRLLGVGLDGTAVRTLTFDDPTGSNVEHAAEIDSLVQEVLMETGADQVDIVAHSMGGLATRWYLGTYPDPPVRRVAFLGTPHHGTLAAHLAWGDGRDEMLPDSPFLKALDAMAPLPDGVEAITVRTPIDTHVLPGESATLDGVPDHVVCCPTHPGLLEDEEVFLIVLDFLERLGPTG
jgi:triacylglycerol lipase